MTVEVVNYYPDYPLDCFLRLSKVVVSWVTIKKLISIGHGFVYQNGTPHFDYMADVLYVVRKWSVRRVSVRNLSFIVAGLLCLAVINGCSGGSSSGGGGGSTPSIGSLNPTSGAASTPVTITGTNFGSTPGTVTFNGTAGTPTSWSATSIVVPVPTGATSGSVVVTVGGVASNGIAFTVLPTPSIASLNPTSGPVGASVTITGTNFGATQGTNTVNFNGTTGTPTAWSATSITVPVPSGAITGNVVVTVGGVASNGAPFTVLATPDIAGLSPTSGAVGATVTITGTNFGATKGTSTVTFNGTTGIPTNWSATTITIQVPSGATTGNVVVTVGGVISNGVPFTVLTTPNITNLNPQSAGEASPVTITGTNFGATQGTSTVTFNGTAGVPTNWSTSSITVPVPAGATTGNVVVTVNGVPSNAVSFTVLPTPSIANLNPMSGPVGASVTITGTNYGATQGTSTVTFNGTTGVPTNWTSTNITVPVPNGATTGNVVVTVSGVASNGVAFTVLPTPSLTNLNPTTGTIGTTVTITGTNFGATQGTSTVMFNGTATTPTSWSAASISAPVPTGATTGNVVVTVNGVASNGVSFTVTGPGAPISDDFHGSTLNPMWTFYADCCGFQKMTGTDALLIVPGGTTHDIYSQNKGVGLLQNIADGDFEVEVKFDSIVTQTDQEEGILVKQDAQNFLFFGVYSDASASHVYAITTLAGTGADSYDQTVTIPSSATSIWVRVKRVGNNWTQTWSTDGTTYTTGATLAQSLTVSSIGPTVGTYKPGASPAPNFMAAVDYFFNTASPIVPADGGMTPPPNQPVFNIWYGDTQTFGQNGIPQEQVNILGNVSAPSGIKSASFTVNGGPAQFLRVGQNPTRLADIDDFNVEICIPSATALCGAPVSLQTGANTVAISATDNLNNTTTHTVTVNWSNTGQTWPIPYYVDWSTVTDIQDVAQIVDGFWAVQPDGSIRTEQVGYNRQIALGDVTWTDYQVVAEMTINHLDCTYFGAGLLMGWSGNANDPTALQPDQPTSGQPIFGLGWYATMGSETAPNAQMTIYANSPNYPETILIEDNSGSKPTLGVKYIIKMTAKRNANNTASHYVLEIWPSGTPESGATVVQADGDANLGSVLLIAFHSDVSFGKIQVCATGTTCTLP